jgi:hypothetical protein
MVIVARQVTVDPEQREAYLAGSVRVVEQARGAAGCLDFVVSSRVRNRRRAALVQKRQSVNLQQGPCRSGKAGGPESERSGPPTGVAVFAADTTIRDVMDPAGQIEHWSEFDRGGHFPAMEVPNLLAGDIRAFFRRYRHVIPPVRS